MFTIVQLIVYSQTMTTIIHYLHILIPFFYSIIAFQFLIAFNSCKKDKKAKKSLLYLVFIFVMCMISGYLSDLINLNKIFVLTAHVILIISCILFILTNQSNVIVKALKDD